MHICTHILTIHILICSLYTYTHRHIYGGPAAEFLRDLADLIENSPKMLLW